MKKTLNKPTKIIITILAVLIGLVLLALLAVRAYVMLPVASYYKASDKAFVIPGLSDDFVPQGFSYDAEKGYFLLSGYSSDDGASPVYIVDKESGKTVKEILLAKENGDAFTGHSGGIDFYGDNVYIAGGGKNCLYVFSYSEMLNAQKGESVKCKGEFSLKLSDEDYLDASFVTVSGDILTVGEFFLEPKYPTLDTHKITTAAGDNNTALALQFKLSEEAQFGIEKEPLRALSLREKVQGMCFDGGNIYLSTSYSIPHSVIYEYSEESLVGEGDIDILGYSVPCYSLDSTSLIKEYKIPPMSEELVMIDGEMYVMCESACNKYIFGKFASAKWCYKTNLSEM